VGDRATISEVLAPGLTCRLRRVADGSPQQVADIGWGPGSQTTGPHLICMYDAYMPNKTISVPEDVVPIIEGLGVPFSTWVADQLRHHAATHSALGFAQQLLADAELANAEPTTVAESLAAMERMERSAPW